MGEFEGSGGVGVWAKKGVELDEMDVDNCTPRSFMLKRVINVF